MNPLERFAQEQDALRVAIAGALVRVWTQLPCIVVSYDPVAQTVVVQPALKGVIEDSTGAALAINLPVLPDVPVLFPNGGGVSLTFPIKEGDEALVFFSARCIDAWWQSGGIQLPSDPRLHDLSDGFALVGPRSQPRRLTNVSTTVAQLRTDDGEAYVQLDPDSHEIAVETSAGVSITAPTTTINGDLSVTGDLDVSGDASAGGDVTVGGDITAGGGVTAVGDIVAGLISLQHHKHTGGTISGLTGFPLP